MELPHASHLALHNSMGNVAKGKRILVLNDQETVLFFLKDNLEHLGFVVSQTSNGKEGIHLLQQNVFDGALLDQEMSESDGLATLRQLRKHSIKVPIILMSADPTRTAMITAMEAGANDYLTKPISPVILKYKCLRLFS